MIEKFSVEFQSGQQRFMPKIILTSLTLKYKHYSRDIKNFGTYF